MLASSSIAMLNPEAPEFFSITSLFHLNYQQLLSYSPFNSPSPIIFTHRSGFHAFEIPPSTSIYSNCCFNYVGLPLYYGWEAPPSPMPLPPPPPLPLPPSSTQPTTVAWLVDAHTTDGALEAETSTASTKANRFCWNLRIKSKESKENRIWVPKSRNMASGNVVQEAREHKKEQADSIRFGDLRTTVMIKNIPNRYTEMLLELLDKHCMKENQKVKSDGPREESKDFSTAFDFVYLPMDFRSGCNLGYAFVNFTDSRATWRLHQALHKQRWEVLGSKKICEITYAKIQGKAALLKNFEDSKFYCESDEFLPISYFPHRSRPSGWIPSLVGKRLSPLC